MCRKLYRLANSCISVELYCGPLSLTRADGMPCLAKMAFSVRMIHIEVVKSLFNIDDKKIVQNALPHFPIRLFLLILYCAVPYIGCIISIKC